jgi:hypothetical protein
MVDRTGKQLMAEPLPPQMRCQEETTHRPERRIVRITLFHRSGHRPRRVELRYVVPWPDLNPGDRFLIGIGKNTWRRPDSDPAKHVRFSLVRPHLRPHGMRQAKRDTPAIIKRPAGTEEPFEVTPPVCCHRLETEIDIQCKPPSLS